MAYHNSNFIRNREVEKTGVANYEDVYDIINDNIDQLPKFYEIEPAVVKEVFVDPKYLPTVKTNTGEQLPDYSLYGTIKARFLESQEQGDEIESYIKPLSSHAVVYPIVGEVVNIAKYGNDYYYYTPLNLHNNVNMNRSVVGKRDGIVKPGITQYNRNFASKKGDININGRFGQGIKFSSNEDYRYPTIKITNLQHNDIRKHADDYFPHVQNINLDGSTIMLSSGKIDKENDVLIPAAPSSWWPEKWKTVIDKNVIVLNSDSLIFNAKGKDCDIHIIANRNVAIASNLSVTLEAGKNGVINLGDADATNPVLKGFETRDLLQRLFMMLHHFSTSASKVKGFADLNEAALKLATELTKFDSPENFEDKIFSSRVKIIDDK
jgi:hypothetical protein